MKYLQGENASRSVQNEIFQLQSENSHTSQQDFSARELQHQAMNFTVLMDDFKTTVS